MNMITPQEYTTNIMHQVIPLKPDIENNMYEVMIHKNRSFLWLDW